MFNILFVVFIGGGVGSVVCWLVSLKLNNFFLNILVGIFIVNLVGVFIIGLILVLFIWIVYIDFVWKLFIIIGFCGGLMIFLIFFVEVVYLF